VAATVFWFHAKREPHYLEIESTAKANVREPAEPTPHNLPILFIAMEYPPLNTAGVFRSLKFTKYLPAYGVTPIVLTLEASEAVAIFGGASDPALLEDIPDSVEIVRIKCDHDITRPSGRLRRFLKIYFQIEDRIGAAWRQSLMQRLPALIEEHKPRALYVSLPPFSAGRLALAIARRYRLPIIVDMRDGWSQWSVGPFTSWIHYYLTLRREAALLKAAAAIVTVTRQLAAMFVHAHPWIIDSQIEVITNGYDFELSLPRAIEIPKREQSSRVVIGYVGAFYYEPDKQRAHLTRWWKKRLHRKLQYSAVKEDWLYRSPYFFMRALALLFARRPELRSAVEFEVVGSNATWLTEMAETLGVRQNCKFSERRSYAEVLQFQARCDAFLCTSVKVPGGQDYAIASKTFDYLRYAKPILGFVTEGAQREFLAQTGVSLFCDPDDLQESSRVLERFVCGGFSLTPNIEFLSRFHRRVLASQLAVTIKRVAA
jgi:hypothetical protein